MVRDDKEIVTALRRSIAEQVGEERFALWFGSLDNLQLDGETLTVHAPDQFCLERLRRRFQCRR